MEIIETRGNTVIVQCPRCKIETQTRLEHAASLTCPCAYVDAKKAKAATQAVHDRHLTGGEVDERIETAISEINRRIAEEVTRQMNVYLSIPGHDRERRLVSKLEEYAEENKALRKEVARLKKDLS